MLSIFGESGFLDFKKARLLLVRATLKKKKCPSKSWRSDWKEQMIDG